ncbi:Arc family DNA-binding protein [Vibrio navarrensis]|uniref:Arc family DNA-binding protein n=1 Tax=Vibrio navarrensis TaxID=29495 RepID=UPI00186A7DE8|nr:Arc family DNA-binding protein [Vibrio navarrensis]MBE4579882.1 hypothetical protein [Vibrio navarrensis]
MEYKRITLRIPEKLHEDLMAISSQKSTSMNAEVIQRLEGSFKNSEVSEKRLRSAKEAKSEASERAKELYYVMVNKVVDEVERRIRLGKFDAYIDLEELEIDHEDDPLVSNLLEPLFKSLKECGYVVDDWDMDTFHIKWDTE